MKKFWKSVNNLFNDNSTVLCDGERIGDWEECQGQHRVEEAEKPEKDKFIYTSCVSDEYIDTGVFKRILLTIWFMFRGTRVKTGYLDPETFCRYYEMQKKNFIGLHSEHKVGGIVYHVTNYLDRSQEATVFDKIEELIDLNQ